MELLFICFMLLVLQGCSYYLMSLQVKKSHDLQSEIDYLEKRQDRMVDQLREYDIELSRFF